MQAIIPSPAQVASRHFLTLRICPAAGNLAALHSCAATLAAEVTTRANNSWPVKQAAIDAARLALAANPSDSGLLATLQSAEAFEPTICAQIQAASIGRCRAAVAANAGDIAKIYVGARDLVQRDLEIWQNQRTLWYAGYSLTCTPPDEDLLAGLSVLFNQLSAQAAQSSFGQALPDLIEAVLALDV